MGCTASSEDNRMPQQQQQQQRQSSKKPNACPGLAAAVSCQDDDSPAIAEGGCGERRMVYCKVREEERIWDERCILTQQEIFKLWTSWNFVHDRVYRAGVHMFLLLFKQHPVLLAIFKRFGSIESGDGGLDGLLTKDNPDLKRHAATVMGLLDDAIINLDKYELVRARLHCTARTHRQFVGFEAGFFWLMRDPFLGSLEAILGEKYTPKMKEIYEKTIDWILGELYNGFQEAPAVLAAQ